MTDKPDFLDETSEDPENFANLSPSRLKRLRTRGMNVAMYALGKRNHSIQEIKDRLTKRELPEEIIQETITKLCDMGLLDDTEFARAFYRHKQEYQRKGLNHIRYELKRKGVDEDIIQLVSAEYEEGERDRALNLALSRVRLSRGVSKDKRFNRLIGVLSRGGYSGSIVFDVAKEALALDEEEEVEGSAGE